MTLSTGAFDSTEITHVEGDVDPVRDMEIIHNELRLKDEEFLDKKKVELERKGANRGASKELKIEYDIVCKIHDWVVVQKKEARFGDWNAREVRCC